MKNPIKCLVPIKRVIDPYVHIRINSDNSGIESTNVKMVINPFDEIALEEAVKLKNNQIIEHLTAVTIASKVANDILLQALARGADAALLLETTMNYIDPLIIAKTLAAVVKKHNFNLVMLGKQAIDDDNNQIGQMLAGILNWSQGTFISALSFEPDTEFITVTRETDYGLESLKLKLPAVITADLRLNQPSYISLPKIMQAKNKPLNIKNIEQYNTNLQNDLEIIEVTPPATRKPGIKVNSVSELIDKLKNEAKVI